MSQRVSWRAQAQASYLTTHDPVTHLPNRHTMLDRITTEMAPLAEAGDGRFYYAEEEHQQYLDKNPWGYCNHGFCQVAYDAEAHGQDGPQRIELPDA